MTTHKSTAVSAGIMPDYSRAGVVLCRTGHIVTAAQDEIISGDTLQMVPIPKNAQILDIHLSVSKEGGTLDITAATGTHVGDGSSPSRFMDDVSIGDADVLTLVINGKPGAVGYTYDEGDDTIDVAITSAATVLETGVKIMMSVFYKMAGSISDEDFQAHNTAAA